MAQPADRLTRFLPTRTQTRGAIIKAAHLQSEVCRVHGLVGALGQLLNQSLIASILLLSISKGGVRQILQLDGEQGPVARVLGEARRGQVRGYMEWKHGPIISSGGKSPLSWMGRKIKCSTVRDLGFGQPYVSTIMAQSDHLADVLVQYLMQSAQVKADMVLHKDLGLGIEAMPGCDEGLWFESVEQLAKIPDTDLEREPHHILRAFEPLWLQIVGEDDYTYHCSCRPEIMARVLESMPPDSLKDLEDEAGRITLSCHYCGKSYHIRQG